MFGTTFPISFLYLQLSTDYSVTIQKTLILSMKRIYYLFFGLVIFLSSCNKAPIDDENQETPAEGEEVVVSFGLGGEITISESPLSRAAGSETSSKDIYAINVFYDKQKNGVTDDIYAGGLFDNSNDMVITLLTGYKYSFECTYIPNGKDFEYYNGKTSPTFDERSINNQFTAGLCFNNMYMGSALRGTNYSKTKDYPSASYQRYYGRIGVDRYYGEVSNYSPKANDKVTIDMIRCVFGLKIIVSGLTDGSLYLGKCFGDEYVETVTSDGVARDINYRSFIDVYKCWKSYQDYQVTETMSIIWTRGNGVIQELGAQSITVKRNVMTTVNINLVGSSTDNSLGFNVQSGEMGKSTMTININADGTVDTNVDPQN